MSTARTEPIAPVAGRSDELRRLMRLAGPVMIAYLGTISMGTIDTIGMIARTDT